MDLTPRFELHLVNAWLGCLPLLLNGVVITALRPAVARRMADMTGYTRRERTATVVASLLPYPFMLLSVWTPFGASAPLLGTRAVSARPATSPFAAARHPC
jgi:hypothetical protein